MTVELSAVRRVLGHGAGARIVLDDLTYQFRPGALTVVTGRSGSGKTTLLRIVAGLDRPDCGQVLLDGRPLGELDREQLASLRRARIGWMGQDAQLVGFLTARENIALALQVRGNATAAARAAAAAHLAGLGLAGRVEHQASSLSAGERQRAGLARALVGARGLLIVDEPTSRLDRGNAGVVAAWLSDAAASRNHTVVCATHDPLLVAHADEELRLGP